MIENFEQDFIKFYEIYFLASNTSRLTERNRLLPMVLDVVLQHLLGTPVPLPLVVVLGRLALLQLDEVVVVAVLHRGHPAPGEPPVALDLHPPGEEALGHPEVGGVLDGVLPHGQLPGLLEDLGDDHAALAEVLEEGQLSDGLVHGHAADEGGDVPELLARVLDVGAHVADERRPADQLAPLVQLGREDHLVLEGEVELAAGGAGHGDLLAVPGLGAGGVDVLDRRDEVLGPGLGLDRVGGVGGAGGREAGAAAADGGVVDSERKEPWKERGCGVGKNTGLRQHATWKLFFPGTIPFPNPSPNSRSFETKVTTHKF